LIPHFEKKETLVEILKSNIHNGLSEDSANELLEHYGENRLKGEKKKSMLTRFLEQFKDVMILILLAAAGVSFAIAIYEKNMGELAEPALILLIVILNAVIGVIQESRAEAALEALKNMSAPHARVIRGGQETVIDAALIVPGDIIKMEAGDFVPADARLIDSASLKAEESALTGESVPSEKFADAQVEENAPLGDRTNMVFSGTSITYGTATAIVTSTGMDTEMGKIAGLLNDGGDGETPLQKKLSQLGKYLGFVALAACAVIFVIGLLNNISPIEMFMTAVSLAVSAIPEGLPAIVTVVLSIGVSRMVKKNAIIKRLPAVETLGSASVVCSDKTGTLTLNQMTLTKIYVDGTGDAENISADMPEYAKELLKTAVLCCNGSVTEKEGKTEHIGDPTETAIIAAAKKLGFEKDELNQKYQRIMELPFDSDRKLMTSVNKMDGRTIVIVKGAFDMLQSKCIHGNMEKAAEMTEALSKSALRVLAVAYKEIDTLPEDANFESLESELTFLGLVGMIDPPRPEAKAAVAICKKAGITPVMITGDHVVTASAIAKELGILTDDMRAVTGTQLDEMSEEELDNNVTKIAVYARVSPENKIRIVKAWQKQGRVVAMTGDGVNDAPALNAADIGCAMGITGTDVAKGAADMILTDDNFATIVDAVKEGRGIYANIKKVVGFLLGTNIGELLTVFIAMLLWHETPLLSMQLLWINLVTDSLPAIALGMEAVEADVMEHKPRPANEGIFAGGFGVRIVLFGCLFAILTLLSYFIGRNAAGLPGGQTMAFFTLALSQVVHSFNMRSEKSLFKTGLFGNKNLNLAVLCSLLMVILVVFTPVKTFFGIVTLPAIYYLISIVFSLIPVLVMEGYKAFIKK